MQVAERNVGLAHIGPDDCSDCRILDAAVHQLGGGDDEALLIELRRTNGIAPGHHAANVGVMDEASRKGHECAAVEHRSIHADVRQVAAAAVRIVRNKDVARLHCLGGKHLQDLRQHELHRAEVTWNGDRLGDDLALAREDRTRRIMPLLDVVRISRAQDCELDFLGDRSQSIRENLKSIRTLVSSDRHEPRPFRVRIRLPMVSHANCQPGGTTVVESFA